MSLLEEFITTFGVWEQARPYLSLLVEPHEMQLVVAAQGQALTSEEAARLGIPLDQAADLLHCAYQRCILDKVVEEGITKCAPATFEDRLDHFAKYENWDNIPAEDRRIINRRFLDEGQGKPQETVRYDPERCWGCGLCASTCPSQAITMEPLP